MSLVFHSDPIGLLGHLLCRGPSQYLIFVSGSSGIQTHVLEVTMRTSYHYPMYVCGFFVWFFFLGGGAHGTMALIDG